MKSGEDFRRAMGPADDGFVRVIAQALNDLRVKRKRHGIHTAGKSPTTFAGRPRQAFVEHGQPEPGLGPQRI